ncbi:MAG TPA: head maturation protease, ClpP-related, partial [Chitinophagaceae bacterium]
MEFRTMTGHIFIYGGIGSGQGEISVNNIKAQIDPQASDYLVHIISPGGEVFEGYGIYNLLKNTGKKVVTQIEGVCASIATLIAFAGEEIIMNKAAEFMIHNPKISDLKGDSYDLRNVADQLDKIKSILIDVSGARAARNGKPISKEKLWELYDNETWLTAQEAQSMGFIDEVQDAIKAVARVDLKNFNMEKKETWLQGIFKNLFASQKFRNQFTETLQDGTVILVMSDDEDWTGKGVVYETGEPLPAGEHVLASG